MKEIEAILSQILLDQSDKLKGALSEEHKNQIIRQKNEISFMIRLIDSIGGLNTSDYSAPEKVELPVSAGYSEYRLVDDCEMDKQDVWKEVKVEGKNIRFMQNDILLILRKK